MSLVEFSVDGPVAVLTLNRPPVNALSSALAADLAAAVEQAADSAVRAVIVTGSPHFAAGADITELKAAAAGDDKALASNLSDALTHLERLRKPVIAAVRGFALGGGLELALACDFRYLADDARVGVPEITLGIYPGAGGTQRLPRLIGLAKARDLIYTGRHVKAEEALALGIADKVFPVAELADAALAAARSLAQGATFAIGQAKRAINGGYGRSLKKGLQLEAEGFLRCLASEDAKEGLSAFLEKRKPAFQGR